MYTLRSPMRDSVTRVRACVEQVINYRTNERSDSLASQLVRAFFLTLLLDGLCTVIAVLCPAEISLLFMYA